MVYVSLPRSDDRCAPLLKPAPTEAEMSSLLQSRFIPGRRNAELPPGCGLAPEGTLRGQGGFAGISAILWLAMAATGCADPIANVDDGSDSAGSTEASSEGATTITDLDGGGATGTGSEGESGSASSDTTSSGEGSGEASTGDQSDGTGDDMCAVANFADPLVVRQDTATDFGFDIAESAALASGIFACGSAGRAAWNDGAQLVQLPAGTFSGECRSLLAIDSERVVMATDAGDLLLIRSATGNLSVASAHRRPAHRYYDLKLEGGQIYAAAGTAGVLRFSIVGDVIGDPVVIPGARDARGIGIADAHVVVADGGDFGDPDNDLHGGAALRILDLAGGGLSFEDIRLLGVATQVLMGEGRFAIGHAGKGVEIYDWDGTRAVHRHSVTLAGGRLDLAWFDESAGIMLVAGGSLLQLVDISSQDKPFVVARENRPIRNDVGGPWFRSLLATDEGMYTALGQKLYRVENPTRAAAPELVHLEGSLSLVGDNKERLVAMYNLGQADLLVTGVTTEGPFAAGLPTDLNDERPGCPGQFIIAPRDNFLIQLDYVGQGNGHELGSLTVATNDPDEANLTVETEIGRPPPRAGDIWRDFSMLTVDGSLLETSQWRKKVVLAKLYNFT